MKEFNIILMTEDTEVMKAGIEAAKFKRPLMYAATEATADAFGALAKQDKEQLLHAAESTGSVLALLTWIAFGVGVVGTSIEHFSWRILLYAVLSLTVVRIVPVLLSLTGTGLRMGSKLFIGWFGPRGLASVVFIIIVLGEDLPGQKTLAMTVVYTVVLSILAHGLTAIPLATVYGARSKRSGV